MKRLLALALGAWMLAGMLAGCGETEQAKTGGAVNRGDEAAWKGAKNPYGAKNWAPRDKAAWENQIRTRGQNQNEYVKTNKTN
jgi:hypothetical protein